MVTFADGTLLPALKDLWKEAFGDGDAYIDFFQRNRFTPQNTLVLSADGVPVSMLTLLPAELLTPNGSVPVRYVYAVATAKALRGRGLAGELLRHARQLADRSGQALVLVPSKERLFSYYEKHGFATAFYLKHLTWSAEELSDFIAADAPVFSPIDSARYKQLRDAYYSRPGYLCWDRAAIDYSVREHLLTGGFCSAVDWRSERYALLYQVREQTLAVKETTLGATALAPVLGALARSTNCLRVQVRLPEWFDAPAQRRAFGMLYARQPVVLPGAYLNLVLD